MSSCFDEEPSCENKTLITRSEERPASLLRVRDVFENQVGTIPWLDTNAKR